MVQTYSNFSIRFSPTQPKALYQYERHPLPALTTTFSRFGYGRYFTT